MERRASPDRFRLTFALAAAAGAGLCALSAVLVLSTPGPGDRDLIALADILAIGVPIGVGLWALWARPDGRFGGLLVAAGLLWFLPTLGASSNEVVYSIGRVGAWLIQPVLIVLMLTFPSGRLTTSVERAVAWAGALTVAVLFLPSAFVVERYPVPTPTAPCGLDCPDNAFMILDAEPAFVDAWLIPLRELTTILVFLLVVVVLARRVRRATRLLRRTLAPVLAVAGLRAALFVVYVPLRAADPTLPLLDVLGWIWLLTVPGMALAFLVGLLRADLAAGEALQRQAARLRTQPHTDDLTAVLRETTEDPTLELAYWIPGQPGRWVDAAGKSVSVPAEGSERCLTEVCDGDQRVAGLIHDSALRDQQAFVEAAGSLALTFLENQRLAAKVDASFEELRESRLRIQAAADIERLRIERDLHDGAQQRLVALRIRLGLAGDLIHEDPARGEQLLRELGTEAEEALEEVRSLAHGVYPSLLADQGLGEALRALVRSSTLPMTVDVDRIARYAPEIESAVYFCCLEALQNAMKHAPEASSVSISMRDDGELHFEIRDDGAGFDPEAVPGMSFVNMRDRLAAVGGALTIRSAPGSGTCIIGTIPLAIP